ncbi:MAG: AbrB/MazE/SpoVT family DNA-binding domain-containing protein [Pseudomonadota bacterium]|nr:AbrB/MazE/SpoVT family DNA-binding domain-containing protein [Pseudomonadota bacterium]
MEATLVTSKGQVTIPMELRQRLGIRQGSRIEFFLVGDHIEMRVKSSPPSKSLSGFGMLKSNRTAIPAHLNPAMLLERHQQDPVWHPCASDNRSHARSRK